jgi:hypothetical protein
MATSAILPAETWWQTQLHAANTTSRDHVTNDGDDSSTNCVVVAASVAGSRQGQQKVHVRCGGMLQHAGYGGG